MKHLIVYCHPNPESFNHAILEKVERILNEGGHQVQVSDLYKQGFQPVLGSSDFISFSQGITPDDIKQEQEKVSWADNLIFIYPTWWFNRPAMLQGWIDRVFSHGFAFNEDETGFEGLLTGKTANLFVTFGGSEEDIIAAFGSIGAATSSMIVGTLSLVALDSIEPCFFYEVPIVSDEERHIMLAKIEQALN